MGVADRVASTQHIFSDWILWSLDVFDITARADSNPRTDYRRHSPKTSVGAEAPRNSAVRPIFLDLPSVSLTCPGSGRKIRARGQPESTGTVTQAEVSIQQDPIYTVITACYNIPIECAQSIAHAAHLTRTTPCFATAPQGPLFRSAVCEKAYIVTRSGTG
jgi:hypothetical protein